MKLNERLIMVLTRLIRRLNKSKTVILLWIAGTIIDLIIITSTGIFISALIALLRQTELKSRYLMIGMALSIILMILSRSFDEKLKQAESKKKGIG
jgi:hypothetical protein